MTPPASILLKALIVILLGVDIVIYAQTDLVAALDEMAWLGLLILIDVETRSEDFSLLRSVIQTVRYCLALLITSVFVSYIAEALWIDVLNTGLWLALIILMEVELHYPDITRAFQKCFAGSYLAILLGLLSMIGVWIGKGNWFDAYDATLWLMAFILVETDIVGFLRRQL